MKLLLFYMELNSLLILEDKHLLTLREFKIYLILSEFLYRLSLRDNFRFLKKKHIK